MRDFLGSSRKHYQEVLLDGVPRFGLTAGLPVNLQGLIEKHEGAIWGVEALGFLLRIPC